MCKDQGLNSIPQTHVEKSRVVEKVWTGEYGSLNIIGLHIPIVSGPIRRCGFVGMGMTLLEEMCHCRGGL